VLRAVIYAGSSSNGFEGLLQAAAFTRAALSTCAAPKNQISWYGRGGHAGRLTRRGRQGA
jgi:hypothetical protein